MPGQRVILAPAGGGAGISINTDASGAGTPRDTIGQVQLETIPWEERSDRPDLDGDLILDDVGRFFRWVTGRAQEPVATPEPAA